MIKFNEVEDELERGLHVRTSESTESPYHKVELKKPLQIVSSDSGTS